jgi:transcription elongation factor GreA
MAQEPYYVTAEGLKKLRDKLAELTKRRTDIIERLKEAKEMGDLSENAEYQIAREAHALNESRINELEDLLRRATIIKKRTNAQTVGLGSRVELRQGLKKINYTIVGLEESDPANGLISYQSPIGKTLMGKHAGEEIKVTNLLGKEFRYRIVTIGS